MVLLLPLSAALAADFTVSEGESIQDALAAAQAGDTITVQAGTYEESLVTVAEGVADSPITVIAEAGAEVIVSVDGTALTVSHGYHVFDGITFEGQYGDADTVVVESSGDGLTLSGVEVRESGRDCIDIEGPGGVTISASTVHHCLWWEDEREDAHGIVAGPVTNLTIEDTVIHTFSGDGLQIDPDRDDGGWSGVIVDGCSIWLSPLTEDANGFEVGTVPGNNGIETRTAEGGARADLTVTDSTFYGFEGSLDGDLAALYIKENVDAVVDRVVVHDADVALRLRGPDADWADGGWVTVYNTVVHDVGTVFLYQDGAESLVAYNNTLGSGVLVPFLGEGSTADGVDVKNLLVLGDAVPTEASSSESNLAVDDSVFVDASAHDYHLVEGSSPIDAGAAPEDVLTDMDGEVRPYGDYDVGADEWRPDVTDTGDTADTADTDDTEVDTDPGRSAADLAGEAGGCSCTAARGGGPWVAIGWLGLGAVLLRRRG